MVDCPGYTSDEVRLISPYLVLWPLANGLRTRLNMTWCLDDLRFPLNEIVGDWNRGTLPLPPPLDKPPARSNDLRVQKSASHDQEATLRCIQDGTVDWEIERVKLWNRALIIWAARFVLFQLTVGTWRSWRLADACAAYDNIHELEKPLYWFQRFEIPITAAREQKISVYMRTTGRPMQPRMLATRGDMQSHGLRSHRQGRKSQTKLPTLILSSQPEWAQKKRGRTSERYQSPLGRREVENENCKLAQSSPAEGMSLRHGGKIEHRDHAEDVQTVMDLDKSDFAMESSDLPLDNQDEYEAHSRSSRVRLGVDISKVDLSQRARRGASTMSDIEGADLEFQEAAQAPYDEDIGGRHC